MSTIELPAFRSLLGQHVPVMPDLPGGFTPARDVEVLVALVRHFRLRRLLEVGVNRGVNARALLDNCPDVDSYTGVDAAPGYRTVLGWQAGEVPGAGEAGRYVRDDPRVDVLLLPRGSFDLTPAMVERACIDFVFIDGDHSYEAVMNDIAVARSIVNRGVIAMHDYGQHLCDGVARAVDQFNAESDRIIHVAGTTVCFEVVKG